MAPRKKTRARREPIARPAPRALPLRTMTAEALDSYFATLERPQARPAVRPGAARSRGAAVQGGARLRRRQPEPRRRHPRHQSRHAAQETEDLRSATDNDGRSAARCSAFRTKTVCSSSRRRCTSAACRCSPPAAPQRCWKSSGVPVTQVSSHTGFPEIMDGRVKTLHPKIHGGLLGRRDVDDAVMREHGIEPIDLLVVNLYPFAATIAKPDCTLRGCDREHRHRRSGDGARRGEESRSRRGDRRSARLRRGARRARRAATARSPSATRKRLAAKAFAHTASYDSAVASYLARVNEARG